MFNLLGKNILMYDSGSPHPTGLKLLKYYIKLMLYEATRIQMLRKTKPSVKKKYFIGICAIFKNEAPYMREWLEFHLLMGVEHFYLYNNNSTDNYKDILYSYIEKGIVTLTEWPDVPGQLSAYTHFYNTYRHESNWVSFLDLDEFICPRKAINIPEWLEDYSNYPLIMLYWHVFGASGCLEHNYQKPVIEQYTICYEKYSAIGKVLWNTDYDIEKLHLGMMHNFNVIVRGKRFAPINCYKHFVNYNIHRIEDSLPNIFINHYWSKAYKCYQEKHKKGSAVFGKSWKTVDNFIRHENHSVTTDYTIFRFLVQLKLRLTGDKELSNS